MTSKAKDMVKEIVEKIELLKKELKTEKEKTKLLESQIVILKYVLKSFNKNTPNSAVLKTYMKSLTNIIDNPNELLPDNKDFTAKDLQDLLTETKLLEGE